MRARTHAGVSGLVIFRIVCKKLPQRRRIGTGGGSDRRVSVHTVVPQRRSVPAALFGLGLEQVLPQCFCAAL